MRSEEEKYAVFKEMFNLHVVSVVYGISFNENQTKADCGRFERFSQFGKTKHFHVVFD